MSLWGPLQERFENPDRPHRLLALDGGGIRGVLTLGILEEVENQLAVRSPKPSSFRLCQYFDYIAGTSTGAIIAAGLARGMSVAELLGFYRAKGEAMFDKTAIWSRWKTLYEDEKLAKQLQQTFKANATLEPQHLKCLLLVMTRNATTDSPWPVSSNPYAKYNDPKRGDSNLRLPLWQLVRASTAAPVYFPPERVKLGKQTFVFVDGGVTPYNNPAFCLYRMATLDEYRLCWPAGEDKLMLVSVGTGAAATEGPGAESGDGNLLGTAAKLPSALMYAAQVDQDVNCRTVGRCVAGPPVDRELGAMIPKAPLSRNLGRAFLYARYNADLSRAGLDALGLNHLKPERVQKMDSVEFIDELLEVGRAAAKQVKMSDFGALA